MTQSDANCSPSTVSIGWHYTVVDTRRLTALAVDEIDYKGTAFYSDTGLALSRGV